MRFRRRVKVFPGFYLNFSNSGISSSIGVRGASITFSKKGTYLNTGIPGTGLSHRVRLHSAQNPNQIGGSPRNLPDIPLPEKLELVGEIKSADRDTVTSSSQVELRDALKEAYSHRRELRQELSKAQKELKTAKTVNLIATILIVGLIVKFFKRKVQDNEDYILDLEKQLNECFVDVDINFTAEIKNDYDRLVKSFDTVRRSQMIWDLTSENTTDSSLSRSAATAAVTRQKVKFDHDSISIIKSHYPPLTFENANGDDLFFYPGFLVLTKNKTDLGLIGLADLDVEFRTMNFIEQEKVPGDSIKVGATWAKVNKNGQPDKRFKDNYQIPIAKYGQITLRSKTGLNEAYLISNHDSAEQFASQLTGYCKIFS